MLLPACSKSPTNIPSLGEDSSKRQGLRIGTDYKDNNMGVGPFSASIYVFGDRTVSVYKEVGIKQDIVRRKSDGRVIYLGGDWVQVGAAKGTSLIGGPDGKTSVEVLFGPGDRMPVLVNALYKIEGTSAYVDWSQAHSEYFDLAGGDSRSEVFSIKNDGLVLESATVPGYTLTLSINAAGSGGLH